MATYSYNPNSNLYYGGYYPSYVPMLNGKLVENAEVARNTDVPVGSYGIFPKADFSEVYIKSWNPNGTTNLLTYKLMDGLEAPQDNLTYINNKLTSLEEKIDNFIASNTKRKEVKLNEY